MSNLAFKITTLALLCMATTVLAVDEKPAKKQYKLPTPNNSPVIILDYEGGFTPPRDNNDPAVLIQADGTVILGAPFGQKKRIESKISKEEIQDLLRFALETQQLADFDGAKAKKEMQKGGIGFAVADAATTVVKIHADGKHVEAKYYALGMMARQYPKIKSLAQFEAVRLRLERLRSEINAGGKEGVAKNLKLANAKLKADEPDVPLLTADDLQSAWQRANGDTLVSFQRQDKLDDGTTRFVSANINYKVDEDPMVTVRATIVPKR